MFEEVKREVLRLIFDKERERKKQVGRPCEGKKRSRKPEPRKPTRGVFSLLRGNVKNFYLVVFTLLSSASLL